MSAPVDTEQATAEPVEVIDDTEAGDATPGKRCPNCSAPAEPADTEDDLTAAVARTKGGSVSSEAREKAKERGHTMKDGSFPIEDGADLDNAIQSVGRAKDPEAARRHIIAQAKRLGLEDRIPESWNSDGTVKESVSAAASTLPPVDWFRDPVLDKPTPLTVGDDGRITGHLALWESTHIGHPQQNINPPRSRSDYAYFHTGSRAVSDGGQQTLISTGHITLDTGHADIGSDHRAASAHYDDTGTLVADVCAGEDQHGIWVAGALTPGVDDLRLHKLRSCGLSGDWRRIGSGLELVAALSVPTPGFPIPRSRVASGEPLALVAAGALPPPEPVFDYDVLADRIADRVIKQQALTAALLAQRDELLDDLDDSEDRMAELLVELYSDDLDQLDLGDGEDGLTAATDAVPFSRMPPQLQKSYLVGKVAKRIRWKTSGDWTRCRRQALKHGMTPHQAAGACQYLHKIATGVYTGSKLNV